MSNSEHSSKEQESIPDDTVKIWRTAALLTLALQVLGLFVAAGYALEQLAARPITAWMDAGHQFVTGVLTLWWALIFGRLTLGRGLIANEYLDKVLRVLSFSFPLLTAYRGALWFLTALNLGGGMSQANPITITGLLSLWGGSIIASYMVFFWLVRWAEAEPAQNTAARKQLEDWLNLSAALTLGMTVINVMPIAGLSSNIRWNDQLVSGVTGGLDILATLLAMLTLAAMGHHSEGQQAK